MTIREAIDLVDRLTPNQYDNEDKVRWLSTLDGMVQAEIRAEHGADEAFRGYGPECDMDGTELLVPMPYDELYRWYLEMKIADANGEIVRCNNAAEKFNRCWAAYFAACNRAGMPRQRADHFRL